MYLPADSRSVRCRDLLPKFLYGAPHLQQTGTCFLVECTIAGPTLKADMSFASEMYNSRSHDPKAVGLLLSSAH